MMLFREIMDTDILCQLEVPLFLMPTHNDDELSLSEHLNRL